MTLPAELASVAAIRGGVLTRKTALQNGCTDGQLTKWIANCEVRSLWRGILTLNPEPTGAELRHRELAHAISVAYAGRLAVSHHSALLMAGLPTYDVDLDTVRLVRRNGGDSLASPGVRISRCAIDLPTREVDHAVVVHEAIAVAQVARESGADAGVVAADAALQRGTVSCEQLEAAVRLLDLVRGSPRARQMLELADGRSESPGESLLRLIAVRGGVPVEPQYIVRDAGGAFLARCDLRVTGTNVLVEFDGKLKYKDPEALFAEKQREDAVRRAEWRMERFVWAHLSNPAEVVRRLRRAAGL